MAKWLEQLESFIGGGPGGPRRVKAFRWLVLIGLIGAALLLIASFLHFKPVDPSQDPGLSPPGDSDAPRQQQQQQAAFLNGSDDADKDPFSDIENELDDRLKQMLENIVGVGTVDVMVTVDSTEETVVQLNQQQTQQLTDETDKNGAKRHITSVDKNGQVALYEVNGGQSPIVVKKLKPQVRGVLVVAKGAENATVHLLIADAISKGLDVPIHRISVVPRKQ
ncbi:stage III sporulation protein AG [Cohnella zeiphila]|uniref:Stage III sporulation protein AG n=1 Tax=Cohnella zeiphila TaxID=2761120 RepID=A0A7X0SIE5_9BACL|nr:stage III sporulation protein AG [Cohnella zeiphila]MBB6730527.1 stage III sporulation protein AG [Cohnella zeiphila]